MQSIFTEFSAAIKESIGLSFSASAKHNCDKVCRMWDKCYASRIERIYKGLSKKLHTMHARGPVWVVNKAMYELSRRTKPLVWVRISVDGSVPAKSQLSERVWRMFIVRLSLFIAACKARGAFIHFPVESMAKARSYRAALPGIVIRRTSQAKTIQALVKQKDHRAWVAAERIHGACVTKEEVKRNIEIALEACRAIREAGQTAVPCPKIVSNSKCGQCKACADERVDVVVYPFHP